MAIKRTSRTKPKAKAKPQTTLQNLAAKSAAFDDSEDEQLVDQSGVFRVTSSIARSQIGHDDDAVPRFASDSLVMAAQQDGFRQDGPNIADVAEEQATEDEATLAVKRQRLEALAARARSRTRR